MAVRSDTLARGILWPLPEEIQLEVVSSPRDFLLACTLVEQQYCARGIMTPTRSRLRISLRDLFPSSTMFVARSCQTILGTASIQQFSKAGLPAVGVYAEQVKELASTRFLVESTKFACSRHDLDVPRGVGTMSAVGTNILRALFHWCVFKAVHDWIIVVHPRLRCFYVDELGFEVIAGERKCRHVENAPGILLRLPISEISMGSYSMPATGNRLFNTEPPCDVTLPPIKLSAAIVASILWDEPELLKKASAGELSLLQHYYPEVAELVGQITSNPPPLANFHFLSLVKIDSSFEADPNWGEAESGPSPFALRATMAQLSSILIMKLNERSRTLALTVADDVPDSLVGDSRLIAELIATISSEWRGFESKIDCLVECEWFKDRELDLMLSFAPWDQCPSFLIFRLIESLGGEIRVSAAHKNPDSMRLSVKIPVLHVDNSISLSTTTIHQNRADFPAGSQALSILVVDDNRVIQVLVQRILTSWGHEVTIARNGQECLSMVKTHSFDLILMDIQMPLMDGLSATRHIRALEAGGMVRRQIYALTSFVMPGDCARCLEAGMDGYIPKPISIAALQDAIKNIEKTSSQEPPLSMAIVAKVQNG